MAEITERELERLVVEELKRNGYPSDTVVPEWKNKNTRIDIAVMDQDTQIPLMIIILSLLLPFFGEIKVGEVTLSNKKKDEEK